jgi:hypothetical protein
MSKYFSEYELGAKPAVIDSTVHKVPQYGVQFSKPVVTYCIQFSKFIKQRNYKEMWNVLIGS